MCSGLSATPFRFLINVIINLYCMLSQQNLNYVIYLL